MVPKIDTIDPQYEEPGPEFPYFSEIVSEKAQRQEVASE